MVPGIEDGGSSARAGKAGPVPPRERVLVTGGSGFLGAGLVRALIAEGKEVHLVTRSPAVAWRLAGLHGLCSIHRADLLDIDSVQRVVDVCRPETIYHLATYGVHPSETDQAVIESVNVTGTANLLEVLRRIDYRVLVHVGSGAEYGPRSGPVLEGEPLQPTTKYGWAKAVASTLCLEEAARGRPVVVVRVFAAYGPWEAPTRLPSYVMRCCLRGAPPSVSAGLQRRDFVASSDVCDLLLEAARLRNPGGAILHAGTGTGLTVRNLVRTVTSVCGCDSLPIRFGAVPTRRGEPPCYLAAIDRTRQLTGWTPRRDLRGGLEQLWAWFRGVGSSRAA